MKILFQTLSRKLLLPTPFLNRTRFCSYSTGKCDPSYFDIVVAGGGLVGAAMARSMAQTPALKDKKILILEGAGRPQEPRAAQEDDEYSNRVIALNNSSKDLFSAMGVWDTISTARVKTVRGMHVWDARNDAQNSTLVSFEAEGAHVDENRGQFYIAENDLVVSALMHAAGECPNVEIRYGASAVQCQREQGATRITLKDGDSLSTALLIGADGANSVVRRAMPECRYLAKNYDQMGVVATLHLKDKIPNTHAWQKFLPTGPLALLPLSETRSSLVWTLPTAQARALLKAPEEDVLEALLQSLGTDPKVSEPFPSVGKVANVAGFPLGLGHATRYCQEGMVLVGDAAHRVHPLAGQGVNLGFGDVACLTQCLERNILDGARFGTTDYLLDYECERQKQNVPMMLGIDFFQQVYGSDHEILAAARKAGIGLVNSSPVLKKMITSFAA